MHQFVQSAIEAAKQGENEKATNYLKQVLEANPNDVDAWLVLAAVMDDPQRKRQCLKRVLTLDPVNQVAHDELMEMDRTEMDDSSRPTQPSASALSKPDTDSISMYQPETPSGFQTSDFIVYEPDESEEPIPPVKPIQQVQEQAASSQPGRKTLTFKFPVVWLVLVIFTVVLFGCVGLLVATQNILFSLPFFGFAALMLFAGQVLTQKVELSRQGIRVSGIFKKTTSNWEGITALKSNSMLQRLELTKDTGEAIYIYTFLTGYPRISSIIQKMRPDLFSTEPETQA
jgi:tetratricopeptide (TPR) repeat protein